MTRTRWKAGADAVLLLQFLFASVRAVDLTLCSSQNTGSGGQSSNSIYMTNGQCHDNCGGYAFAITQWQNCWCSNEAPGDTTSVGSCNEHCPGYPSEMCGNQQQGLFGYVALGKPATGTMGAGGGSNSGGPGSNAPASSFVTPSSSFAPPPSTQVIVSSAPPQTIVQTQLSTTQVASSVMPPPSSSTPPPAPIVIVSTQQNTETQVSSVAPSTAVIQGPTSTITPTPQVITTASAVTVSGQVVTHLVTTIPSATPSPAEANEMPQPTRTGLSSGAVAGITIGALLGAALLAGLIFLFLWRRRQTQQRSDSEGAPPKRNASVLSRVGLLRHSNTSEAEGPTLPQIRTTDIPMQSGPASAKTLGSSQMSDRRNSRPLFSDNRLNPNALMTQTNLSRTSVSTLQDNHDYSRPLEVRNPDEPA